MASKFFFVVALFCLSASLFGLEAQRGKLKLVVNERNGRFSLYGTEDVDKPVWTPLFLSEDPTTSKWKIQVGGRISVLGDDSSYTGSAEATDTGAKVVWTSKSVVATMSYDFVLSPGSTVADGLRVGLSVVNVSDAPLKVGLRWLLDTNLGEKKDHFRTSTGDVINSELKWEGTFPDFWTSAPAGSDDQVGLLVMAGKAVTTPSKVYFANWRRLDDTPWEPVYKQGRDFNLLPYSFNDSAVAYFYDVQELSPASTREAFVILGLRSAKTFEGSRAGSANPLDDLLKKNQNPSLSALDQDLLSLQAMLTQLDAKLADPSKATAEDLRLMQAVLDQMQLRRKALEAAKP